MIYAGLKLQNYKNVVLDYIAFQGMCSVTYIFVLCGVN